ncbi:MAG: hypothetical protein KJ957_02725 [Candidatus Omnitrophica bacterium]|nr:hypothetical protein [Candidatus Omnitrophota bacterium]MBU1852943.1 hypothetical protein [Candidatus Omnitrophota bacterium]
MKRLIILVILMGLVMVLPKGSLAAQCENLTDVELDQINAGGFLEIMGGFVEQSIALAEANNLVDINGLNSAFVNTNAVNSTIVIQSNFNFSYNVNSVTSSNTAIVTNTH